MTYYKILNKDGTTPQGFGKWPIPKDGEVADWMPPVIGSLVACRNGYHLMRLADLMIWLSEGDLWIVTPGDELVESDDKVVVRTARLIKKVEAYNESTLREFACRCAESVIHIWEKHYPDDHRPREAIAAARSGNKERMAAAGNAAWDAAGDAVWDAAGDAVWDAARVAAWDAARSAARATAGDAAGAAALACGAAARGAAWATAEATARDSAWADTEATARDAAWVEQTRMLIDLLGLEA